MEVRSMGVQIVVNLSINTLLSPAFCLPSVPLRYLWAGGVRVSYPPNRCDETTCRLWGCPERRFFDGQVLHDFCCQGHAQLAKARGEWPRPANKGSLKCSLPGCSEFVYRNSDTGEVCRLCCCCCCCCCWVLAVSYYCFVLVWRSVCQSRYGAHAVFRHQSTSCSVGNEVCCSWEGVSCFIVHINRIICGRLLKGYTPWMHPGAASSGKGFDSAGLVGMPIAFKRALRRIARRVDQPLVDAKCENLNLRYT